MKTCVECKEKVQEDEGEMNDKGQFVCLSCAEELREAGEALECPECGAPAVESAEDKLCAECGAELKTESQPEAEESAE